MFDHMFQVATMSNLTHIGFELTTILRINNISTVVLIIRQLEIYCFLLTHKMLICSNTKESGGSVKK